MFTRRGGTHLLTLTTWILVLAAVVAFPGCGTRRPIVGEEKVVEASGRKPGWVKAREDHFEKKGVMHFRGMVKKVRDLTLGRRQAEADAKKRISESITTLARTEYEDFARGANLDPYDVAKFVEDGMAWTSQGVNVSGVMPHESYWEKVRVTGYDGVEYVYNCYTLLRLARQDYQRARLLAVNSLLEKARAAQAGAAEEAAHELRRKLEGEGCP